jgi:flavin-binding protein dodecin
MPESSSSPRIITGAHRKAEALRLRAAGHTYRRIADMVGWTNPGTAHEAVMSALVEVTREPAETLRDLELARLDAMQGAIWDAALAGELQAVDRVLKIMERRAKLCGLDSEHLEVAPPDESGAGISLRELFADDPDRALGVARWLHENLPPRPTSPHPTDGPPDTN